MKITDERKGNFKTYFLLENGDCFIPKELSGHIFIKADTTQGVDLANGDLERFDQKSIVEKVDAEVIIHDRSETEEK